MLEEVRLNREKGFPFFMAFAYPPTGPILYTGDLGAIRDHTDNLPTHHAWIISYENGVKYDNGEVILLGKHACHHFDSPFQLDLFQATRFSYSWREKWFNGRPSYVLVKHQKGKESELVRRYRSLPKTYLKELKEFDNLMT